MTKLFTSNIAAKILPWGDIVLWAGNGDLNSIIESVVNLDRIILHGPGAVPIDKWVSFHKCKLFVCGRRISASETDGFPNGTQNNDYY